MSQEITSRYEHDLQRAFRSIEKRGIAVDSERLEQVRLDIKTDIDTTIQELNDTWNVRISIGNKEDHYNIKSPAQLTKLLKDKGFQIPKVPPTKDQKDKGETEYRESVSKIPLQLIYSKTGDLGIKKLLSLAELNTLKSRYVDARLYEIPKVGAAARHARDCPLFLSSFNVAGTLSGRRSSRKNIFGYGGNAQNLPKHTANGEKYLECLVPRSEGNVFIFVDQKSAEEWPVAALSENQQALAELHAGINRHRRLASFLFTKPEDQISKNDIEYYLGKKTRHAKNYGMKAPRMSLSLAGEGFFFSELLCNTLLSKVSQYDPTIETVFHKKIQRAIEKTRVLQTPFGRERYFLAFRPNSSNFDVLGEAYSYIPQSTVGDNTGLTILKIETELKNKNSDYASNCLINDCHDSIAQECVLDTDTIYNVIQSTLEAFNRKITFENGIEFVIPIEVELGFDFKNTVKVENFSREYIASAVEVLKQKYKYKNAQTPQQPEVVA